MASLTLESDFGLNHLERILISETIVGNGLGNCEESNSFRILTLKIQVKNGKLGIASYES